MAQLYFKRAKIFMHGNKTIKHAAGTGPVGVPAWVLETGTYINGIADGSIINMTAIATKQEEAFKAEEQAAADDTGPDTQDNTKKEIKPPTGLVNGSKKK